MLLGPNTQHIQYKENFYVYSYVSLVFILLGFKTGTACQRVWGNKIALFMMAREQKTGEHLATIYPPQPHSPRPTPAGLNLPTAHWPMNASGLISIALLWLNRLSSNLLIQSSWHLSEAVTVVFDLYRNGQLYFINTNN